MTYPDGKTAAWGYDGAGRLNALSEPGGGSYTVAHDGAGNLTHLTAPNGGSQTWGYDSAGRLVRTAWQDLASGTALFTQTAVLDAAGQRTLLQDSWGTTSYGYDANGRLRSAAYPDGTGEQDQYDPAGNRTVITGTTTLSGTVHTSVTSNQFDAADQLLTSSTSTGGSGSSLTSYGYDGNGNQVQAVAPSGTTTNTFNQQNQLTHVSGPSTNLSLVYDGQGDRLRSYEQASYTPTLRNEAQDLAGGLSALASDGQADYAYLQPGDGSAPLSRYDQGATRTTYLASDLLGSVRLATDPANAVIGAGAYDAWGNARPTMSGSDGQVLLAGLQAAAPFGYAGQQYDAGPGTYAMRARTYDPSSGRFQSQDPQPPSDQQPVTINPYEYAGEMPTEVTDPSGQWWLPPDQLRGSQAGRDEQQAEGNIISSFSGYLPPAGPTTIDAQFGPRPTPQLPRYPNVPLDVLFDVPVRAAAQCKAARPPYLMANILSTASHQVWDIESYRSWNSNANTIRSGVRNLRLSLQRQGYYLPKVRTYEVPAGAHTVGYVGMPSCGVGTLLLDCNPHLNDSSSSTPQLDGPFADPAMQLGTSSIDQWFAPTTTPSPRVGPPLGIGAHHLVSSSTGSGSYEWWVQEAGIILWRPIGDVGTPDDPHHYTNGALDALDIVLGGSLSGGQECSSVLGCGASITWLAFNLDFAKQTGVTLARAGIQAARLGKDGMRAFLARGGVIRLAQAEGEHLLPEAEQRVTLAGQQGDTFLEGLGCPTNRCFPAGTKVSTPGGSASIEKLQVGDLVLSEDPSSGTVTAEPVQAVIVRPSSPLIALDLSDESSLKVQPNHLFWVDGGPGLRQAGWLTAGQLVPGDRLRTADGREVTVLGVRWNVGRAIVYTLTVAHDHTFFVGDAHVLVHNANPDEELACDGLARVYVVYNGTVASGETVSERELAWLARSAQSLQIVALKRWLVPAKFSAEGRRLKTADDIATIAIARDESHLYVALNAGFYKNVLGYNKWKREIEDASKLYAEGRDVIIVDSGYADAVMMRRGNSNLAHAEVILHQYLYEKGLLQRIRVLGVSRSPCETFCRPSYFDNLLGQERVLLTYVR